VIFSVPFPVFVIVTSCEPLLPTVTFPKFTLAGFNESCDCVCTPFPLSGMASGEPGALLVMETLPLAAPAAVGENFTLNVVLCPAVSVAATKPLIVNPVPDADPPDIATLPVPVFVSVTDIEALAPASKLPKFTLAGFAVRCPCVPVPLKAIVKVGFVALLVIVIAPVALPDEVGANCDVNEVVWPAFKVIGFSPLMLNPVPDADACDIAIAVAPVFVSVIDCVPLLPTATLPNAKLPGFAPSVAFAAVPAPARLRVWDESGALSVNLIPPVTPWADVGVNCTLKEILLPALIVAGRESPLIPKPLPEICARFMTKSTLPWFVTCTACVLLCPTFTFPNCSTSGEVTKSAAVPVPVNSIVSAGFEASLTTDTLPLFTPETCGSN